MRFIGVLTCLLPLTAWCELAVLEKAFHSENLAGLESGYDNAGHSLEKAYAQYSLVVLKMAAQDNAGAQEALDLGLAELAKVENGKDNSHVMALWAALGGMKIALNPMSAMHQGPQNQRTLQRAIDLDRNNPTAWLVSGMALINTPAAFGGGAEAALSPLTQAIELFESGATHEHQWGHADAYVWRAQAYQRLQDTSKAKQELERALELAPNFVWAKKLLAGLSEG